MSAKILEFKVNKNIFMVVRIKIIDDVIENTKNLKIVFMYLISEISHYW